MDNIENVNTIKSFGLDYMSGFLHGFTDTVFTAFTDSSVINTLLYCFLFTTLLVFFGYFIFGHRD